MEKCTQVGDNAFYDCLELDSVEMPLLQSAITRSFALSSANGQDKLKTLNLPKLSSFGGSMLANRKNLETVVAPKATQVGVNSFYGCTSLTQIDLPSVVTVNSEPFKNCTGLQVINFGKTVTSMNASAFGSMPDGVIINVPWAEDEVSGAPWGGTGVIINYDVPYSGTVPMPT